MASSVNGFKFDQFLWGHLKKHIYAVPQKNIKHSMARLQTAVTMVSASTLRYAAGYTVEHTAICPDTDGGQSKHLL
jgi:hypothetical protein